MSEKKSIKTSEVNFELSGLEATAKIGRVAAKGTSNFGTKKRGKYAKEILKGSEFSVAGNLMEKVRIIDRENNYYKELVINTDTGETIRDVEQKLNQHIGHGSAKFKKTG